jgi:Ca2+/Na+ antiporter
MMDTNDIIASIAFGIGFVLMYRDIEHSDKIDVERKNVILLGLISSLLWFVHQYRRYGLNMTTVYTSTGIIVQLYILNKILLKEKDSK